jgi:hypothetical protein
MLLSCCPKNSQDAEKKHPAHKDQVQRPIPISKHGLSVPYRPGSIPGSCAPASERQRSGESKKKEVRHKSHK